MLIELHIAGLGVIDDLDLELHPGLNVLTGETGAGKTMVTVGLALALGARASPTLVREGASSAQVQARFRAPTRQPARVAEWAEDGELVLARRVGRDGRTAARIGGQIVPVSALASAGAELVEVHGQHQAQRLMTSEAQGSFVDRMAGEAHLRTLDAYRSEFERLRRATTRLETLLHEARDRERDKDLLAYQVREIEGAGVTPGEVEALRTEESRLSHAERLLERATAAENALGLEGGATDTLADAAAALRDTAGIDPDTRALADRVAGLSAEASEAAREVRTYREGVRADPHRLVEVHERLQVLASLERKYGDGEEGVLRYLEDARDRLGRLEGADEERADLERDVVQARERATAIADELTRGRRQGASDLRGALEDELHQLGMPGATIAIELRQLAGLGPDGQERAEMLFSAGPGQALLPFSKVASGGELSRTMLACRSVLADLDDVPTLVFDEVDAGIGGEAGLAVGRRLSRLAGARQVVVVTHLPQIACFADRHVRVRKEGGTARVEVLEDGDRVEELSRMLSGLSDSEFAASHAQELLAQAARPR